MVIPALITASTDHALRGAPMGVYVWLICHRLDVESWRPVKFYAMAHELAIKPHTAARAMRLLSDGGYIERRGSRGAGFEYRLRMTRASAP